VVLSRLNETGLKQIALMTGGAYVRSVMGDMDLNKIYLEEIKQKIEKRELRSTRRKIWQDRFQWVIGLALALLMAERMVREKETPPAS
jgi:Ca-activated chloride channel family protein